MIKKLIKAYIFDWRKERAIKEADRLTREQRRKLLVLVFNGKPVAVSMQQVKQLIRKRKLHCSPEKIREIALYTTNPAKL